MIVAFEQHHIGPGTRRGIGGRATRRAAADHQYVALVIDRHVARGFVALDAAGRDDVLRRVDRLPGGAELLQVVKIVACFA